MTATRGRQTSYYETVMASMGFSLGKHYWEIKIDHFGTEEDIFIGICKSSISLTKHAIETPGGGWGW